MFESWKVSTWAGRGVFLAFFLVFPRSHFVNKVIIVRSRN